MFGVPRGVSEGLLGPEESGTVRNSGPAPLRFHSSNFHHSEAAAQKFHHFLAKTFLLKDDSISAAGLPHTWACGSLSLSLSLSRCVEFLLFNNAAFSLRGFERSFSGGSNVTSRPSCRTQVRFCVTSCARTSNKYRFRLTQRKCLFFIRKVPGLISDRLHVNPQPVRLDAVGALGTVASFFRNKLYLE